MTAVPASEESIATITIRDLDDEVKRRLRVRAAEHGVSMEAEVRTILAAAVAPPAEDASGSWVDRIRTRLAGIDDATLEQVHAYATRPRTNWAVAPEDVGLSSEDFDDP